ncbi:hypothetical protein D3C81_1052130 [compost metagenome]
MTKIKITPTTEIKIESFCRCVVVSLRNNPASRAVRIGVVAKIMPPSADEEYFKPKVCRMKNPSGYNRANKNNLGHGLPLSEIRNTRVATRTTTPTKDKVKRKARVSIGLAYESATRTNINDNPMMIA